MTISNKSESKERAKASMATSSTGFDMYKNRSTPSEILTKHESTCVLGSHEHSVPEHGCGVCGVCTTCTGVMSCTLHDVMGVTGICLECVQSNQAALRHVSGPREALTSETLFQWSI
jgi:hypothetical protein